MREVNYNNPKEVLEFSIYGYLDILKNSRIINSTEEQLTVGFLILSLYQDGILRGENMNNQDSFLEFCKFIANDNSGIGKINNYQPVVKALMPILSKFNNGLLQRVYFNLSSSINFPKSILTNHFAEVFDKILYQYIKVDGRTFGAFTLPLEITRLMFGLVDIKPNARVYNPFAGPASFGVQLKDNYEYFAQENNEKIWILGFLRLIAHNRTHLTNFTLDDSIENWPSSSEKFDIILSSPPFGLKVPRNSEITNIKGYSIELFLIEKGLKSLKQDGQLITLLPQGFLSKGMLESGLGKRLIEEDVIDTIIALPGGILLNTGIPLIILFLNKRKLLPGRVRFIDAKEFVSTNDKKRKSLNDRELISFFHDIENPATQEIYSIVKEPELEYKSAANSRKHKLNASQKLVEITKIKELGYNLNVPLYFQNKYEGTPLRELGTFIKGTKTSGHQEGKLVKGADLKEDPIEYILDLNKLANASIPKNYSCISETCLLLASRGKSIKPTLFHFVDTPIFIPSDILAFKIDETKCDTQFLVQELLSAYVSEQLNSFRVGIVIPGIRRDDLLSVIINIPGFDDKGIAKQKSLALQKIKELSEEKKKKLVLFNKIHGLENEIYEQNTYLRHTLAGPSSNLRDSIAIIKSILINKVVPLYPEILNQKLSDKHQVTLNEYLNIIERDATKIVSAVSNHLKVEIDLENKKLEPIGIINFLKSYAAEYNDRKGLNFNIEFSLDEEAFKGEEGSLVEIYILANHDLLQDLFNNLVDNAKRHAFSHDTENRIEIFLMKSTDFEERDEITILFSNTGKSFPEDFEFNDFIRKGSKTGANAGDGFGGWYINEIIKKMNGELDMIDEQGPEGLPDTDLASSFEIRFPFVDIE